jgi:hypothetical protein
MQVALFCGFFLYHELNPHTGTETMSSFRDPDRLDRIN